MRLRKGGIVRFPVSRAEDQCGHAVLVARGISCQRSGRLKSREVDARDEKIGALQKASGETAMNLEICKEINRIYERNTAL